MLVTVSKFIHSIALVKHGLMAALLACALFLSACAPGGDTLSPHNPTDAPPDSAADTSVVIRGLESGAAPGAPVSQAPDAPEGASAFDGAALNASPPAEDAARATPQPVPLAEQIPGGAFGEEADIVLPARGVVTGSSLNLRAAANDQAMVVGSLAQGDSFTALNQVGDWYYVDCNLGKGYAHMLHTRLDGAQMKPQREELRFYDDVAGQFVTVEKEFYMASWEGQPRRFDAKLSPLDFGWDGDLAVVHPDIREMAGRMARSLYQSDGARVTCYFGQYYPSAVGEDGSVHQTGIHEGIDFAGPDMYAPFYALTDGVVTSVQDGEDRDQYNWIAVRTGDVTVFYVHHYQSSVSAGDTVTKGDKLGLQGDNGARGAYHVHLEVVTGDAPMFNRSKDTVLADDPPYDFWRSQGY